MQGIRSNQADLPLPPPELMARVGQQLSADKAHEGELSVAEWYIRFGARLKESVLDLLPENFELEGKRVLDFGCGSGRVLRHFAPYDCELVGCDLDLESIEWLQDNLADTVLAFQNPPAPPIDAEAGSFDLIFALSVFTHLVEDWSDWLLELHRLVRPSGYVIVSFIGPKMASEMTSEELTEDDLGMNFIGVGRGFERGSGPIVFHSHWWLHAHWGRAFEILELVPDRFGRSHSVSQGAVLMRAKDIEVSRDDLEWPDHRDARELRARRVNLRQLKAEADREKSRFLNEGRRLAEAPRRRAAPSPRPQSSDLLTPLLVDCMGRGGSTLLMQLLSCSPQIRVEGPFPYERRYFLYLTRWAQLLSVADWPEEHWGNPELVRGAQWQGQMVGPPPWGPDATLSSMSGPMLRAAWRQLSRRLRQDQATYYAEKSVDTHRLDLGLMPETRLLVLLRDPRDTFVSIEAFNARRGRTGFGRGDLEDEAFLESFVERHRRRAAWLRSMPEAPWTIRYEDIVADITRTAREISERLRVEFDPGEMAKLKDPVRPDHVTADSIEGSVGRWRTELDPHIAERIGAGLEQELRTQGYEA